MTIHFDDFLRRVKGRRDCEFGTGVSEQRVVDAETRLGNALRGSYRRFLLELGWGYVVGDDVFGIGAPECPDVVTVALRERTVLHPRLPQHLVPVMNDGAGNLFCLDVRGTGEPPIVGWWHEEGEDQEPTQEGDDFATWLWSRVEEFGNGG